MPKINLLNSYGLVVTISLILGLVTGGSPIFQAEITIVVLAVMMMLSLSEIDFRSVFFKGIIGKTSVTLLLNYGLLTGLILAISLLFTEDLRSGWILMAAVPSAIAVVPFSYILKANTGLALMGTTTIYMIALLIAPSLAIAGIGQGIDQSRLIYTIIILIVIPIGLSRIPNLRKIRSTTKTPMINLCFGVLVFIMTGANRGAFTEEASMVFWVALASLLRTFGVGLSVLAVLRFIKTESRTAKVYVLFSSYKNLGLTAALAMALISYEAAIPATICIPFELVWLVFLKHITTNRPDITKEENRPEKN